MLPSKTSHAIHYLRRNVTDFQKFLDLLQSSKDTDTTIMVTAVSHGIRDHRCKAVAAILWKRWSSGTAASTRS